MVDDSNYVTSKFKKNQVALYFFIFESPPYTIPENTSSVSDKNLINRSLSLKTFECISIPLNFFASDEIN